MPLLLAILAGCNAARSPSVLAVPPVQVVRTAGSSSTSAVARRLALPTLLPFSRLSELNVQQRLSNYEIRDAVWVPNQPILVNRDFDFGVALSLEDIGPAIAVVQRRKANAALAQRLASIPPIDAGRLLHALCRPSPAFDSCAQLAARSLRIYGLLFGEHDARLQVVLEVNGAEGRPYLYSALTEARPVDAFVTPGVAQAAFTTGLVTMAPWIASGWEATATDGRCNIGGAAKLHGKVIQSSPNHILLVIPGEHPRRLLCPSDAFEAADPAAVTPVVQE